MMSDMDRNMDGSSEEQEVSKPMRSSGSSRLAVPALLVVLLATLLGVKLMNLPLNRILELRFCVEYYQLHDPKKIPADGQIPESQCKVDSVQEKLGWLMGAFDTTMQACDLAIAAPMGYLADKIGRRLVLALNCTSTILLLLWIIVVGGTQSIPPATILAGPFLALFGGGSNVFKSVSVALMSDLAKTDIQRTSNISYFLSTDYITMLVGPMLAATMMPLSLRLPLWTGVALISLTLPLISLLRPQQPPRRRPPHAATRDIQHNDQEHVPFLSDSRLEDAGSRNAIQRRPIFDFFTEYYNIVKASPRFRILLLAKFLSSFASSSSNLLAIYITVRTGWTYSEVGYMYTLKGMINIFLAVVAVPSLARYFSRKDPGSTDSSFAFNFVSSKATLFVSVIGAIFVGSASNAWGMIFALCFYALGSVLPIFMYAVARSPELGVLDESNEGSGFTVLVVVQALGSLLGAPTMAAVWVKAIGIGGHGLGLPYFLAAIAYALAFGAMLFVREETGNYSRIE